MPTHKMSERIYRRIQDNFWGQAGRNIVGPIPTIAIPQDTWSALECFTIVDREPQGVTRNHKEVMYICVNEPSLNRNLGKYQLWDIWDQVLQDTPALQLK